MNNLLFELLSEEIPAHYQKQAAESIKSTFRDVIVKSWPKEKTHQIEFICHSSPRRLTLIVKNMPSADDISEELLKGPKVSAADEAIAGFMRKNAISSKSDLFIQDECYCYCKPRSTLQNVAEEALKTAILSVKWPKTMRYGDESFDWIRPIHNILCLLNDEVLPFTLGAHAANNQSYGHRFMHPDAFDVQNIDDYLESLYSRKVMFDANERVANIKNKAQKLAESIQLSVVHDEKLFDEVAGLVEWPTLFMCRIDEQFMSLPREVIVSTLRFHQKYIMLQNKDGSLAPYFIVIANVETADNGEQIMLGNERVLRARLGDAVFSIEQDRKKTPEDRVLNLQKLVFHRNIGTLYDKTLALQNIAQNIAVLLNMHGSVMTHIARAAYLCKSDLASEMVGEFPELQGIMGYYQAKNNNEDDVVSEAIKYHYRPQGHNDMVPTEIVTVVVALANKLYDLNELFRIKIYPTSSKDPYALRRAAIGVIKLVCKNKIVLPLRSPKLELLETVLDFIKERAKNFDEPGYDLNFIHESLENS